MISKNKPDLRGLVNRVVMDHDEDTKVCNQWASDAGNAASCADLDVLH